jgi:poly-gamma-glutamate synthesis protein (capsule biosynthesis protein)
MLNTIDMYNKRDWKYYGGGINLEDAMKPALFDVNGNKIAFIGCNGKTPGYATASANTPGAVHCDMDAEAKVIKQVVSEGYMPIFTFQHIEYYSYSINKNLFRISRKQLKRGL